MSEYAAVDPYGWIDELLPARRRGIGVVYDEKPIGPRFPDTAIPVPDEPTICATDPDLWFPELGNAQQTIKQAKGYCQHCWMRQPCREYGIANPKLDGIWGGLTKTERTELKRRTR